MTEDDYRAEIARLTKERDELFLTNGEIANTIGADALRLRRVLRGIAEYCSTDHGTLGAIARLAAIRNTADQALRDAGPSVAKEEK